MLSQNQLLNRIPILKAEWKIQYRLFSAQHRLDVFRVIKLLLYLHKKLSRIERIAGLRLLHIIIGRISNNSKLHSGLQGDGAYSPVFILAFQYQTFQVVSLAD